MPHETIITCRQTEQGLSFEAVSQPIPVPPSIKRKISIHSWRKGDLPIKMKFKEINGEILLDIISKPKETEGTSFKIVSPLVKSNKQKIEDYIVKVFKSVKSPIILNGRPINSNSFQVPKPVLSLSLEVPTTGKENGEAFLHISESKKLSVDPLVHGKAHQAPCCETQQATTSCCETQQATINFVGGHLTFIPLERKENFEGLLRICESERLICDLPITDSLVPKEVTINFNGQKYYREFSRTRGLFPSEYVNCSRNFKIFT